MADRIPVLLDTDIGSDIDDAVALAYLLKQPRCELVGITTVTGDVVQRAACAEVICKDAGREVPIHTGASSVLLKGPGQPLCPQYKAIQGRPHKRDYKTMGAIDFLRNTIRSRPGEITLLAIGPLTNVALAFAVDPELPRLLKNIVLMAGYFFPDRTKEPFKAIAEWNVLVDPIASALAYAARPADYLSVGLDVTLKCYMPKEEVRKRFTVPPLTTVAAMAEVWFQSGWNMVFHDPLAASLIFDESICTYAQGHVTVTTDGPNWVAGQSLFTEDPSGPHRVAKTVDPAKFFEHYFGVFK